MDFEKKKNYQKLRKTLIIAGLLILFIVVNPNIIGNASTSLAGGSPINNVEIKAQRVLGMDSVNLIRNQLINSINGYIKRHAPDSKLSPDMLLLVCVQHDFDLALAMSQAHIESHYGTKGIASRTNSVFNVGTFDDGTILYRYKDPNQSIEPYADLMKRNYLRNKTAKDLLQPRSFVDYKGDRYATFKYYEYRVGNIYKDITENTPIADLYKLYTSEYYTRSVQFYVDTEKMALIAWNK